MATQIGRFELLSEIAKSERGCVYKANDTTSGQTVALKTIRLEMPEEEAKALLELVEGEADTISSLSSPNIAQLFGVGEFDNILCAAMEYVQGNSISTMLARKEGFSIWDLLDISRQVCLGLDHAHSHNVLHYSFEPAKVMVQWDGTVKILSFGISKMGMVPAQFSGKAPLVLHYVSPEQLRGEPIDARSNFFSWGAILYEMVTDHKAFDGDDAETVRHKILEENPLPPAELNHKIHPAVSDLILKALSKMPEHRFQNGQQLIAELEECKKASAQAKKSDTPAQGLIAATKMSPGASTKPTAQAAAKSSATAATGKANSTIAAQKAPVSTQLETQSEPDILVLEDTNPSAVPAKPAAPSAPPAKKAAAAAAGAGTSTASASQRLAQRDVSQSKRAAATVQPRMSAAATQAEAPSKFTVDPMMAEGAGAKPGSSFSDLAEMPPLKEVSLAPAPEPVPSETPEASPLSSLRKTQPQKPKVQPKVAAKQAINEIKSVPPRLMLYSIAAAVGLVLVIGVAMGFHFRAQSAEDEGTPASTASSAPATVSATQQATQAPPQAPPVSEQPSSAPEIAATPEEVAPQVKPRYKRKTTAPARAAIIPGQVGVDSSPQGAQVQVDGRSDSSWLTPLTVTQLTPGRHTIALTKPGYISETRTLEIGSGSKSTLVLHLAAAGATVSVRSDPQGASIFVDGKDTGRTTPAQINIERGSHVLLVRKQGYLDESTSASLQSGQTFHFAPSLRALGNAEDIKTVGKFKKIFGRGETADMGTVSIKTQPKGAQVAVNRRMLDKASPVQFMVGPGNYIIDITASGYKPIHRVVTVEKGGKTILDEAMQPE